MRAINGVHYNNSPGIDRPFFTLQGRAELSSWQRARIEQAFYDHSLGDEYVFPEYTEIYEYEPEQEDQPQELEEEQGDDTEPTGADYALADRMYDEGRDDACLGHDTPGARRYRESREKLR